MNKRRKLRQRIVYAVIAVLWVATLIDMVAVPACQTDPLFRLLECAFAFALVPLLALAELEKN